MPRTVEQLEEEFAPRALRAGSVLILGPEEALALIGRARTERFPVLGVDGFHVTDESVQPDLGHSVDLSSGNVPRDSWAEATKFVRAHSGAVGGFEVVLGQSRVAAA